MLPLAAFRVVATVFAALAFGLAAVGPVSPAHATSSSGAGIGFSVNVVDSSSSPPSSGASSGNSLATARYSISLSGLLSLSYVEIWVHSNPALIASGYANDVGNFATTTSLPLDLEAGGHAIEAAGTTPAGMPFSITIASLVVTSSGVLTPGATGDGTLSLIVPARLADVLGAGTLVNNMSTSTGSLGQIYVNDQRVTDKPGWILYADVKNFVLSTDPAVIIPRSQLATSPQLIVGSTEATGITVGAATVAGSASYPMVFAQAAPQASLVGNSTFDASFTFVAPQQYPVGIYSSTITLTLVSK